MSVVRPSVVSCPGHWSVLNLLVYFHSLHVRKIYPLHWGRCTRQGRFGIGVLSDSVASKATDLVLVNEIGYFDSINVIIVFVDGGEEGLEIAHKVKCETKPSRFVSEFCNTLLGVLGVGVSHVLRRVAFTVGNVVVEQLFLA